MGSHLLLQANRELEWAWDSTHALCKAQDLDQADRAWRSTLGHLEKLWHKVKNAGASHSPKFHNWNGKFVGERDTDPLLAYLLHARNADHHTIQDVSDLLFGSLSGTVHPRFTIQWNGPELVALPVIDRGVSYSVPECHLGAPLQSRHPVVLATAGCNYYADYLGAAEREFFARAP